jgi:hypothetical protein
MTIRAEHTEAEFMNVQLHWGFWALGYNELDFFLENEEYRPFDGCKIEI